MSTTATVPCRDCGSQLAASLLSCPGCGALTRSERLAELAAEARDATTRTAALAAWREALALLPANSRQSEVIRAKVETLVRKIDASPAEEPKSKPHEATRGKFGRLGGGVAALAIFALTKGKLLLLGLTKGGTILTMLASFGIYWTAWGWKFAAAIIGSIYIHEMGHVAALRRFGIAASAPMFIPGIGAVVRLKEALHSPIEDARVGLAGPIWGLGAALAAWAIALATGSVFWSAIAALGAWINLFNLLPLWQLDGSRAFRAMSRLQRWIAAAVLLAAFFATSEHLLLLLLAVAIFRAFGKDAPTVGDRRTLGEFSILVAALSSLTLLRPVLG